MGHKTIHQDSDSKASQPHMGPVKLGFEAVGRTIRPNSPRMCTPFLDMAP